MDAGGANSRKKMRRGHARGILERIVRGFECNRVRIGRWLSWWGENGEDVV